MFKIGDFSRLTQISVKALRYYDDLGLLPPARVDADSGYRYYSASQLPRLHRLLALKELRFSLEEIAPMLDEGVPPDTLRALLARKRAAMQRRVAEEQARLARVEALLHWIEKEDKMPEYEVIVKRVEPQLTAAVRDVAPSMKELGVTFNGLFDEVIAYVTAHGGKFAGPAFDRYLDSEMRDADLHIEACMPIAAAIPGSERVQVAEVEGVETMACTIHRGSFAGLGGAFNAILKWIEANGCHVAGPGREVYLEYDRHGDPDAYVTEIQFPIQQGQ